MRISSRREPAPRFLAAAMLAGAAVFHLGAAAAGGEALAPAAVEPGVSTLQVFGSLRAMMHQGETGTVVKLDSLLPDDRLYGVGALGELRGEVTIVGGQAWLAYPDPAGVRITAGRTSDEGAALLVAARVDSWVETRLEARTTPEALDRRLGELAAAAGLPAGGPFVFLVEGTVENLQWHVIDGRQLRPGASGHEGHREAALKEQARSVPVALLGFYSEDHQGVFTHMGSRTHIHVVVEGGASSGHVDAVTLPEGTAVRLAATISP